MSAPSCRRKSRGKKTLFREKRQKSGAGIPQRERETGVSAGFSL